MQPSNRLEDWAIWMICSNCPLVFGRSLTELMREEVCPQRIVCIAYLFQNQDLLSYKRQAGVSMIPRRTYPHVLGIFGYG